MAGKECMPHFTIDGVLAGAPAASFNNLLAWSGMVPSYFGTSDAENSPSFISSDFCKVITQKFVFSATTLME